MRIGDVELKLMQDADFIEGTINNGLISVVSMQDSALSEGDVQKYEVNDGWKQQ